MCYDKGSNNSLRLTALDAETEKINVFLVTVSFTSHKTLFLDDWKADISSKLSFSCCKQGWFLKISTGDRVEQSRG